jgi:hypothetical protein
VSYIVRKDYAAPGPPYPTYIVALLDEEHLTPMSVQYDPDQARATRFSTREKAEKVRTMLDDGKDSLTVIEVP